MFVCFDDLEYGTSTLINKYVLLAYVLQNGRLVFYRGFILSRKLNETGIFSVEDLPIF